MRLICGVFRLDGSRAESATIDAMAAALTSSRLTPTVSRVVAGPIALATVAFSGAAPVMSAAGADIAIAADCRLDRPDVLAETLGVPTTTPYDALLGAASARWQEDVVDRVDGDFALAAWDPGKGELLCGRDIHGVRPLCYAYEPGRLFAFASLPRGLHASGVVPVRPDLVDLGCVLLRGYGLGERTGFSNIRWLRGGHSLVVGARGVEVRRVWQPDVRAVGNWRGSAEDAASTLRILVDAAVARRVPHDRPIAVHLSGGLDSSAVAVLAARHARRHGQSAHAYSLLPMPHDDPERFDERSFVQQVLAQEPDLRWEPSYAEPMDRSGVFDPDLPLAGSIAEPADRVCAMAVAAGCARLLTGAGGDEGVSFHGSRVFVELARRGRWQTVVRELRALAVSRRLPLHRVAAGQLIAPLRPEWLKSRTGLGSGRPAGARRLNALSLLRPAVAREVDAVCPSGASLSSAATERVRLWTSDTLGARADHWSILGARHGIAFTHPLADRAVIDFALSLPPERLVDGGYLRQPLRNAMKGVVPEGIRWRTSKFSAFPDLPVNLSNASAALVDRVRLLQHSAAANAFADLQAIERALLRVPGEAAAAAAARVMNRGGFPNIDPAFKIGVHAMRALTIAEYLASVSGERAIPDRRRPSAAGGVFRR